MHRKWARATAIVFAVLTILAPLKGEAAISSVFEALKALDASGEVRIIPNPAFPEPLTQTTLSLESSTIDLRGASIIWIIDNRIAPEFENKHQITITAPPIEKTKEIIALIALKDAAPLKAQYLLKTQRITLIHEAESYTPAFYKGRQKVGDRTPVRLSVIAEIPKTSGGLYTPEELVYQWQVNGKLVSQGKGQNTLKVTGPSDNEQMLITVSVFNQAGVAFGKTGVRLVGSTPTIFIYEDRPLEGAYLVSPQIRPLMHNPVRLFAVPFFAPMTVLADKDFSFQWLLNGEVVPGQTDAHITLDLQGDIDGATVAVYLKKAAQIVTRSLPLMLQFGVDQTIPSL